MKLLIVTQAVDSEDPVLGFFVRWVEELAKHFERIEVICLFAGRSDLPANVRVHSLGKEKGKRARGVYALRFLWLVWRLRCEYDTVFVHMNQEYVLIAGWLWKLWGKRISLWRNHYAGSLQTDAAAAFCTKVFCTSKHSYTAKYKKAVIMPVGVDTGRFHPDGRIVRKPRSILFLARMAPAKRPEMLISALGILAERGIEFSATFAGSPLPRDAAYYEGLKKAVRDLGIESRVAFRSGIPNDQTPDLYRAHEIFVNASPSGMLDKTIFEAAASGCLVLAASEDFSAAAGAEYAFADARELAVRLEKYVDMPHAMENRLSALVERNSLETLATALRSEL